MLLENSLKKYKEIPEAIKQIVGLVGLTATIIFTFMILNIFIDESDKVVESVKTEEINKVITLLPRGRLNFYESTEGYQLSLNEYEAVCKNTKIVTQRSVMGANIVNISATQLYFDNGNKIDKYFVKWDSSLNKCFAGYTLRAIEGVSDTITVSGEAKGFFKTSIDTRVYFIKNY
jgi:hypothetical protein